VSSQDENHTTERDQVKSPEVAPKSQSEAPHHDGSHHKTHHLQFSPTLNFREIWRIVKIHKYFVATVSVTAVAATALISFFSTPEYRTSVVISVVPNNSYKSVSEVTGFLRGEDALLNKMSALEEYFKSQELANKVIDSLVQNKKEVPMLGVSGLTWLFSKLGFGKALTIREALDTQPRLQVAASVMAHLKTSANFNNNTFVIESMASDPQLAAFLANESAKALLEINHKIGLKMVVEVKTFLHNQSAELGAKLKTLETQLTQFQSKNQILSVEEAERWAYNSIDKGEQALTETEIKLAANLKLIEHIKSEMAEIRRSVGSPTYSSSHLYLAQLQHRLSMLQYQQALSTPDSPEAKKLTDEIKQLSQTYKKALDSGEPTRDVIAVSPLQYYNKLEEALVKLQKDNKQLISDREILNHSVSKRRTEIPKLALTTQQLTDLRRNIQLTSDLYLALRKKIQETEIQEAGTINDISILSDAPVPDAPHTVSVALKVIFALFVGFFFSVLSVLAREAVIPTVRNRHDLEKYGMVILGEVPAISQEISSKPVVVLRDFPVSYEADVYRSMRMKLIGIEKSLRPTSVKSATVFLMTSARGGNGKTFTAVNTAMTLSKAGYRTLLIDLDFRNPSVRDYYAELEKSGLIDNLALGKSNEKYEHTSTRINQHLEIAFGLGGVPDPAEILDSNIISEYLKYQRTQYDYIIVDAPPILGVIDSQLIAPFIDLIIFVIEHRKTHREDISLAVHMLKEIYSRPILAVINFVHREFTYYDTLRYYEYRSRNRKTPKTDVA